MCIRDRLKSVLATAMIFIVISMEFAVANTSCSLPAPDIGGGSSPSMSGTITDVRPDMVSISSYASSKIYRFRINRDTIIYTAFGGDGSPSRLRPGLSVRIWTKDCKIPLLAKVNQPAYIDVFSFSVDDKPPSSYFAKQPTRDQSATHRVAH